MTGLEILNRNVQITHEWIDELDAMLGWNDKGRTYRLLRVTLQTLRDCLPLAEIADFAAQMPTLLRGGVLRALAAECAKAPIRYRPFLRQHRPRIRAGPAGGHWRSRQPSVRLSLVQDQHRGNW
jgi:uncharacterized protein (DUF2267 family)